METIKKFISYRFSALLILVTLLVCFIPGRNLNNFDTLATRAENIDIRIRVLLNLGIVVLLFAVLRILKSAFLFRPVTQKVSMRFSLLIALTLIAFLPAMNINEHLFAGFTIIYRLIGIGHIGSGFADLAGVLEGAYKVNSAGEYFQIDCPGSCVQYRWQYSHYLLNLPFEHFLATNLQLIAFIFWVLMIFVSVKFMGDVFFSPIVLVFLLLPASLLAYERMNIENLIFVFIPLVAYVSRTRHRDYLLPIIIVFLTVIKFYPLVLAILFLAIDKATYRRFLIYILTLSVGLIISLPDIKSIGRSNLVAGFAGSYGLPNFLALLSGNPTPHFTRISTLTFCFGIIFCAYFFVVGFRVQIHLRVLRSIETRFFVVASFLSIIAWLSNSNYMYRLILFIWCLPLLVIIMNDNRKAVGLVFSSMIVGMLIIPISLSPVRNIVLAQGFSILTGLLICIVSKTLKLDWHLQGKSHRRSELKT